MIETLPNVNLEMKKELVQRIVCSRHINRSARLRDLFVYLCHRVLEDAAEDIHELEVGNKVFGRPQQYDTSADNIVRVHASMLRKRLSEYFEDEGEHEALVIEIPRGNYAPHFRERTSSRSARPELEAAELEVLPSPSALSTILPTSDEVEQEQPDRASRATMLIGALAAIFFILSVYLFLDKRVATTPSPYSAVAKQPILNQFWSGIFPASQPAEVVLDDASLDFYRQATGRSVALAEYFDRSYLAPIQTSAEAAKLDPQLISSIMMRRQSFFADSALVWKLAQVAGALNSVAVLQFARDFSFRQVKAGNVVLLGNRGSNPWIQPFEPHLSIHWIFDPTLHLYYPRDMAASDTAAEQYRTTSTVGNAHAGYATISFLPNLNGSGNVLIISATGGSAMGSALDFLLDENSMLGLRATLPHDRKGHYPYFDVLLRTERGANAGKVATILVSRPPAS